MEKDDYFYCYEKKCIHRNLACGSKVCKSKLTMKMLEQQLAKQIFADLEHNYRFEMKKSDFEKLKKKYGVENT